MRPWPRQEENLGNASGGMQITSTKKRAAKRQPFRFTLAVGSAFGFLVDDRGSNRRQSKVRRLFFIKRGL